MPPWRFIKAHQNSAEQLNYLYDRNALSEANGTDDKWYIYFLGGTVDDLRHIEDGTGEIGKSYLRGLNEELVHINESEDTAVYVALTFHEEEIITPISPKDATTLGLQQRYVNESLKDGQDGAIEKFSIYTEKYKDLALKIYERTWLFKMDRTNVLMPFSMLTSREILYATGGATKKTYNTYTLYAPQITPDFDKAAFKKLFNQEQAGLGTTAIEKKMERLVYAIDEYFINGKRPEVEPCENLLTSNDYKKLVAQVGKNDIWIQVIDENPCILEQMYDYDEGHFAPGSKEYEEILAKVVCYPLYGALAIPAFSVMGPTAITQMGRKLLKRFSRKMLTTAGGAISVDFTMQLAINYYFHPEVNKKTGVDRYSAAIELTQLDDIAASAISSVNYFNIPTELVSACLTGGSDVDVEVLMNPERYFSGSFDFSECQQNVLMFMLLNAATKNLNNHTATLGRFSGLIKDSPESVQRGLKEIIGDSNMEGILPMLREHWQALVEVLQIPKDSDLYRILSGGEHLINTTKVLRRLDNRNITVKGVTVRASHIEKLENGRYRVVIFKDQSLNSPTDAFESLTDNQRVLVSDFSEGAMGGISKESADFLATSKSINIQDILIRDAEGKSYSVIEDFSYGVGKYTDDFFTTTSIKITKATDSEILAKVKKWQGKGEYPGVDDWEVYEIPAGSKIYGGVPGESEFYSTIDNLQNANFDKVKYWESLQVKPNPTHGFRPKVAEYTTKETIKVGVSITLANPQFGKGGGWQVFIEDFTNKLEFVKEIPLK